MLLFKNKIIDPAEIHSILPDQEEKKVASTIVDGEYRIPAKEYNKKTKKTEPVDIRQALRTYCASKGIIEVDYLGIDYCICAERPNFVRNDDYFKFDRENFLRRWYLPSQNSKIHFEIFKQIEKAIYESLEAAAFIERINLSNKKYVSNLYAENTEDEKVLKNIFVRDISFKPFYDFFYDRTKNSFVHHPQYYGYHKAINIINDIPVLSEKENEIIVRNAKERLQNEIDFLFTTLYKKPLVKFWLDRSYGRVKAFKLDPDTLTAIADYGHEEFHCQDGVLFLGYISAEELEDFFVKYEIKNEDLEKIQNLSQKPIQDEYIVKEYKYYSKTAEQQKVINKKILEYKEEKNSAKQKEKTKE
jgi:hypothetical protein